MKILMVSIFAPHFFNWTEQLRESGHEVYWLDVFDSNTRVEKIDFVHQIIGWRYKLNYPGRYFIKNKIPRLNKLINQVNERHLSEFFEKTLREIKPDVVQSFVLQTGGYPILKIMKKHPQINWVFSAWGNDLYYRQQNSKDLKNIKRTLPEFKYMFTDCLRDNHVAKSHGFKGEFLGAFPGGGGYDLNKYNSDIIPFELRKNILIKGYQSHLGRCNIILEAIVEQKQFLSNYKIIVFGGNDSVKKFIDENKLSSWRNFVFLELIPQREVLKLMGESLLYIGNSLSDGMPNTLLEAIIMGAFPIQSNPGGATAELIEDGKNGLLIKNPEDPDEIFKLIQTALNNPSKMQEGVEYNFNEVRPLLEREYVKRQVLSKYDLIEKNLKL
jgi:glycosyltransferase involved in cell wall biosynthesis